LSAVTKPAEVLVWHDLLSDEKFSAILFEVDEGISGSERERGCSRCCGPLHRADYPRKARGVAEAVARRFERRFSFCCGRCRKRHTPPSVRFLGRRVYVALAVLVGALIALAVTLAESGRVTGARARTVARWLRFFQQELQVTRFWSRAQGLFSPPLGARGMPATLVERFASADASERLLGFLKFVTPITVSGWR
jgi:hypothetical protein